MKTLSLHIITFVHKGNNSKILINSLFIIFISNTVPFCVEGRLLYNILIELYYILFCEFMW